MNWQELSQQPIDSVLAWAETQSWCEPMKRCAQDAEWHAEGDVWTHTKLVCRELTKLDEWASMSDREQSIITFVALFHDVAKPITTEVDPETGRVTSPMHAVKGEHIARNALRELGCELQTREEITKLVRYHGRPAFLLERSEPSHEVVRLSWLLNNRLLFLFALADTRGRDTESMSRPEENLHYWRILSEEHNCFDQRYPFANEQARFVFFRSSEPNLHYVPHQNFSCNVTVVSGLPGSGKDTWLRRHQHDLPVVSLDEIRRDLDIDPTANQGEVVQAAREQCREFLRTGTSFAFNATNLLVQTRRRWIELFADYHARISLTYIEPPLDKVLQQNKERSHSIPESVIRKLARKCEPPTWVEAHDLVFVDGS